MQDFVEFIFLKFSYCGILSTFYVVGFCPVGFCLVGFCPVGFCPVGFCPGFSGGSSSYPVSLFILNVWLCNYEHSQTLWYLHYVNLLDNQFMPIIFVIQ